MRMGASALHSGLISDAAGNVIPRLVVKATAVTGTVTIATATNSACRSRPVMV